MCIPGVFICVSNGYLHVSILVWIYVSSGMWVCQHAVCECQPCVYIWMSICVSIVCMCVSMLVCMRECARNSLLGVCVHVFQLWVRTSVSVVCVFMC